MLIKWWKRKRNSKKAAAILRRLLTAGEKGLPEINIEFGYVNSIPEETAKKQVAAYYKQINTAANVRGIRLLN